MRQRRGALTGGIKLAKLLPILSYDLAELFEDGTWMSREQLLSRLAASTKILHSMPPMARGRDYGDSGQKWFAPNLCGFRNPPWLPEIYRFRWLSAFFSSLRDRYRQRLLSNMGGVGRPIRYIWHPVFVEEAFRSSADIVVYHIYDDYRSMSGATSAVVQDELRLLKRADLVICTSQATMEKRKLEVDRPYHVITHGVDEAFLSAGECDCPPDIAVITGPRIGYIGRINCKVDFDLVDRLAQAHREWSFIFVGPFVGDKEEKLQFDRLLANSNVYWLGLKTVKELPAYYAALDISMLCYVLRHWIMDGSPLKLVESLAAGVPVITAATAGCLQYERYVRIAKNFNDWEIAIREILSTGTSAVIDGKEFAATQTWNAKVLEIQQLLEQASKKTWS